MTGRFALIFILTGIINELYYACSVLRLGKAGAFLFLARVLVAQPILDVRLSFMLYPGILPALSFFQSGLWQKRTAEQRDTIRIPATHYSLFTTHCFRRVSNLTPRRKTMPSLTAKDRAPLCRFSYEDGRRCRTPRISSEGIVPSSHLQIPTRFPPRSVQPLRIPPARIASCILPERSAHSN
jgi:hypothetical protein